MTPSKERDWLSLSLSFIVTENVLPLWSFLCKLFTLGKVRRGIIKFEPEAQTSTCEFLCILMTFKSKTRLMNADGGGTLVVRFSFTSRCRDANEHNRNTNSNVELFYF